MYLLQQVFKQKGNKTVKIGLLGFEFESPNKGCEALSYSFLACLKDIYKSEELLIYNFSNKGLGFVPVEFPNIKFKQIPKKIKDISFVMIRAFAECDCIFDITMGDSFSDIYSKQYCINNMKFKVLAETFGKKYVLLPQTYGPYNDQKVLKRAAGVLKRADKVYCRDAASSDYIMEKCGISTSLLTTDLAFMLPYDKSKFVINKNKFNLGINVSGLLWKGGFYKENQFGLAMKYEEYIQRLIEHFLADNKVIIHLISHVIDMEDNPHDDDYRVCSMLKEKNKEAILAPAFKTPMEAKSYIANMDCFIGARMHSTIAAFSSKVPTIPFSYSRKFEGLYDSLGYKYLIHGNSDTLKQALEKTYTYVGLSEKLKSQICESMVIVNKKIDYFVETVVE